MISAAICAHVSWKDSSKHRDLFAGRLPSSLAWEASPHLFAMDGGLIVKAGPFDLPNHGRDGTLTWSQRQKILEITGVSAAVRDRKNTHGRRHLTLSGPIGGIQKAKDMAMAFVVASQQAGTPFAPTAGCEGDWQASLRQMPASSSWMPGQASSSWQTVPAMPTMVPQQAMMNSMLMQQLQLWQNMQQQQQQHPMVSMQQQMQNPNMFAQPMYVVVGNAAGAHRPLSSEKHSDREEDDGSESDADESEDEEEEPEEEEPKEVPQKQAAKDRKSKGDPKMPAAKGDKLKAVPKKQAAKEEKTKAVPKKQAAKDEKAKAMSRVPRPPAGEPPARLLRSPSPACHTQLRELTLHRVREPCNKKQRLVSARGEEKTVKIITSGWKHQGCEWSYDFAELMQGPNGMFKRLAARGLPSPDIAVDCRPLKRTDLPTWILTHTGYHREILEQVVHHTLFSKTMQSVVDDIQDAMHDHTNIMVVLAVCTGGSHRSVAFALVLQSILQRLNLKATLRHLSEATWKTRGLCQGCPDCRENDEKQRMFDEAFDAVNK